MLGRERQELILERLRLYGRVRAAEVARELDVSEITIRRDLNELHSAGLLSRVHGGAVRKGEEEPGKSGPTLVGLIVPSTAYYFSEVIRGAESVAESLNVRLVLAVSTRETSGRDPVQQMLALGAAGLLVAPPVGDAEPEHLSDWVRDVPVPMVLMERSFGFPDLAGEVDFVRTDHAHGALIALKHLHSLGHQAIAAGLVPTPTSYWLEKGIARASEVLGIEGGLHLSVLPAETPDDTYSALRAFFDEQVAKGTRAFFIHNDLQASRVVEIALERGMRVPEDVAVVAYDDVVAAMAAVPLTAVSPPKRWIGSMALEQLVRRLHQPTDRPEPISHVSLLPMLKVRDSCGARIAMR